MLRGIKRMVSHSNISMNNTSYPLDKNNDDDDDNSNNNNNKFAEGLCIIYVIKL
jgi:hypothetical protein